MKDWRVTTYHDIKRQDMLNWNNRRMALVRHRTLATDILGRFRSWLTDCRADIVAF